MPKFVFLCNYHNWDLMSFLDLHICFPPTKFKEYLTTSTPPLSFFLSCFFSCLSTICIILLYNIKIYIYIIVFILKQKMKLEVDCLPLSLVSSQLTMLASLTSPRYLGSAVSVHSSLSTISFRVLDFF